MLLHGWPESWYAYRHQLLSLSRHGYAAAAPDMRGYGGTDSPPNLAQYDIRILASDVVCMASKLGYARFVVIGHDFGSYLAWNVALLHPRHVMAVCGMSVPYVGHTPRKCGPLTTLESKYGRSVSKYNDDGITPVGRDERLDSRYHYMLHHCLPGVGDEYDKNCKEALFRLYAYRPGVQCVEGTPEVTDGRMFIVPSEDSGSGGGCDADDVKIDATCAPGFWARLPKPAHLPPWLSPDDLAYYVSEFERTGFGGGLNWYRMLDRNWEVTRHLAGAKIAQPALFIAGDEDSVIKAHGGTEKVRRAMEANCDRLTKFVVLRGAGHWIQQERPEEVNAELLVFLESLPLNSNDGSTNCHTRGNAQRSRL